ncbi:MAG TPA: response regulator [Burkholderiaceae bacterium]|jgi:DNA-binding response OmpR family regulator|nr:response regulator [Burkholderiaceae bacterium]
MSSPPASSTQASGVLVVDDDPQIGELLGGYLGARGFRVATAANGAQMRERLQREPFDLVLLDLGLPGEDGLHLTGWLREHWHGAIIIVTGRGEAVDRVVGLELGADDYVAKPFDLREILARVRAVLRRAPANPATSSSVLRFAGFTLDTKARTLKRDGGDDVALTNGEYELLLAFVHAPHKVQSRDELLNATHGRDAGPYDKTIDVQVVRLRRKIERDAAQPDLIKAVRGAGYVWTADVKRDPAAPS